MLLRLFRRSLSRRRGRLAVIVLAVLLASAMVSALGNLSLDLGGKVGRELRAYGPNLLLTPRGAGSPFPGKAAAPGLNQEGLQALNGEEILGYAPYLYAIVKVKGQPLVLAGTLLEKGQAISPWWRLEGDRLVPGDREGVVLGKTVARVLGPTDLLILEFEGQARSLKVRGVLETGGSEDNQVLVDLALAQELVERPGQVDLVQVSALTRHLPLDVIARDLENQVPGAEVRILRQVAVAEKAILGKVQLLMALVAALVLAAAGVAVFSTMTTTVLERTREVGLLKSLGARDGQVALLFGAEAAAAALLGGAGGYGVGLALAEVVGKRVFDAFISPQPLALLGTLGLALAITFLAAAAPVRRSLRIEPATVLRGE